LSNSIGTADFQNIINRVPDENGLIVTTAIPLSGLVLYPDLLFPVTLADKQSRNTVHNALKEQKTIVGITLRHPFNDLSEISADSLHAFGTEFAFGNPIHTSGDNETVLTQGRRRVEIIEVIEINPEIRVRARIIEETQSNPDDIKDLIRSITSQFQQIADITDVISEDIVKYLLSLDEPVLFGDFVTTVLSIKVEERLRVLEISDLNERFQFINALLSRELDTLELREEISGQIHSEINRNQREHYLREQLRAIQIELGEEDIFQEEVSDLSSQIDNAKLPKEAHSKALKELSRLNMMPPMAPEVGIIRTYLDWMVTLPWAVESEDNLDLQSAQSILDQEHYGLAKIKDRILEHIAVRKLAAGKMKSPILCFLGPPGVGKTSLGKSIASALGREFVRVSLGGVRDEAEIRGHRRTYIGAMPGRIIQTMRRAGTVNPVFMLDEIDKLGADFRGDPASALLEVLDPEQNRAFSDHYLDTDYDLSKVLFIATANDLYNMPPALLDRLEIIEFPGYTEEEKLDIARRFLIPKQLEANGLSGSRVKFEHDALTTIIRDYTYEAGVRNLDREIANVCRKTTRLLAENKRFPKNIRAEHITRYLGPPQFIASRVNREDSVGIVTGLAWTSGGGDVLTIEVSLLPGKGNVTLTGQLGDVMQESAQTALSYMRSRAREMDVPADDFENYDLHVHLPEGAVPKDGPSAGITLATAIISTFTERKIRSDYAMTGEITLRGRVLPVGGIKEKLLASRRAQLTNVIIPRDNEKDLADVPAKLLKHMNITFVEDMQEVINLVLLSAPVDGRERDQYNDSDEDSDS